MCGLFKIYAVKLCNYGIFTNVFVLSEKALKEKLKEIFTYRKIFSANILLSAGGLDIVFTDLAAQRGKGNTEQLSCPGTIPAHLG